MTELYIGLMSGTSLDGVDGVLAEVGASHCRVLQHIHVPMAAGLQRELLALNARHGSDELHRAALAANALVRFYAQTVRLLLDQAGLTLQAVRAIGAHGQTVRHQPGLHDGAGYTLQLNAPALLAETCGITVVADFRSRDVAAGGQGAPLVPLFHRMLWGHEAVAVLNLGGMANVTLLDGAGGVMGFDCGPGNVLLDSWCQRATGEAYDAEGRWASAGTVHTDLLQHLLADEYFGMPPPKSTGRDHFNASWLDATLAGHQTLAPVDIQATLAELTASACATCVMRYGINSKRVLVCGGGACNTDLMARLQRHLPALSVLSTDAAGLPPLQVEAAAFAWLARQAVHNVALDLPPVTGGRGARVLGALYPA